MGKIKIRVAFDVHGTLDCDDDGLLMGIFNAAIRNDEVFIISGPPIGQIKEELSSFGINSADVTIISIVDWLEKKGTDMWQDENGHWWCSEGEWWSSKGEICREYSIDMIFDDTYKYKYYMPKTTKFILRTGNGNEDV